MRRYQLVPWATGPDLDTTRAMEIAQSLRVHHPTIASPRMAHLDECNRLTGGVWRGDNQPPVLVFSATPETALKVREAYGRDVCFLESRATLERL